MRITAEILPRADKTVLELPETASAQDALKALDLRPDAYIVIRGELPIPVDTPLSPNDHLRLITVISGG